MPVMDFPTSAINGQQTADGRYYFDSSVGSTGAWRSTPLPVGGLPAGSIMAWGTNTPPANWLIADGAAVSRTVYSSLFAVIGTTYGTGDGSTTFNLPDLRGRVAVGRNAGTFGTLGATGGAETHTLTTNEMPSHNHRVGMTNDGTVVAYNLQMASSGNTYSFRSNGVGGNTGSADGSYFTGGGQAHNNLQPYQVLNYIIKTSAGWTAGDSELATRVGALETAGATTNKSGLVPVNPSSLVIASGTATASGGTVSFSNITSLGLRDVFSNTYKNYRIIVTITGTSGAVGDFYFRLGNTGSPASAVDYQWQVLRGYGTTVAASSGSAGYWWVGQAWASTANADRPVIGSYEIGNPAASTRTVMTGVCGGDNSYYIIQQNFSGTHNVALAYSDLFLVPSGQSFSGTIQVYGYR